MKRWIRSKSEVTNKVEILDKIDDYVIIYKDKIVIDIEPNEPIAAATGKVFERRPAPEVYRDNVRNILENEFNFEVLPDTNGERGHISESDDGISLYFDIVFEINNKDIIDMAKEAGLCSQDEKIGIFCIVVLRISDHSLTQGIAGNPTEFVRRETKHSQKLHPEAIAPFEDNQEELELDRQRIAQYYSEGLDDLRDLLKEREREWIRRVRAWLVKLIEAQKSTK